MGLWSLLHRAMDKSSLGGRHHILDDTSLLHLLQQLRLLGSLELLLDLIEIASISLCASVFHLWLLFLLRFIRLDGDWVQASLLLL